MFQFRLKRRAAIIALFCCCILTLGACAGGTNMRDQAPASIATDMATTRVEPTLPTPAQPAKSAPKRVIKIGVLLPLSGTHAELGNAMLDAAILALNDKHLSLADHKADETRIILIPKDTKGKPSTAITMAQQSLAEGAEILLGPLFSQSLEAVKPIASSRNIPVIAFSNNTTLAGSGAYLMGFVPEQQIVRVMDYAAGRGIESMAALLPNNAYGRTVYDAMSKAAMPLGIRITGTVYYQPDAPQLRVEIGQLLSQTRSSRLLEQTEDEDGAQRRERSRYGFDALLFPEGGARLEQFVVDMQDEQLDLRTFTLLGSGQWDDDTARLSSRLDGSWFAGTDPQKRRMFEQHFTRQYGYRPPRLASLAYDAGALLATLAYNAPEDVAPGIMFRDAVLTDRKGFNGPVDGIFRFLPNGIAERGLTVLEAQNPGFSVVDRAPAIFR